MAESSEAPQPTVIYEAPQPPAQAPVEAPTSVILEEKSEVMPVDRQPVSPKPADIVTPDAVQRRSVLSKALSAISFGRLGK